MTKKLCEQRIPDFLIRLASNAPAPGGGSVAALAGAQAAALMAMVCRLTLGKEKYAGAEEEIRSGLQQLEIRQEEFMNLVDADTEAYNAFAAALSLPKGSAQQKTARKQAMRKAAKTAAEVPARTLVAAHATARLIHRLQPLSNQNCLSDMGTAMQMAWAAVLGASMNVLINLPGTGDADFNERHRARVQTLKDQSHRWVQETTAAVFEALA